VGFAVIVNSGCGDIGVAEPFLHLGDVRLMVERIGDGRRAQRMDADPEAELRRIAPHQPVDHVGIERLVEPAGAVVPDRPEERTVLVSTVAGGLEVIVDQLVGSRMRREIPRLLALARRR
jgi:hypothetical protein